MLYALTSCSDQSDRIHLFPTIDAAQAAAAGRPVYIVAAQPDPRTRRLVPSGVDPEWFDPTWTTPIECHGDGSFTARGPLPDVLFVD